jgi:hypothetical protein
MARPPRSSRTAPAEGLSAVAEGRLYHEQSVQPGTRDFHPELAPRFAGSHRALTVIRPGRCDGPVVHDQGHARRRRQRGEGLAGGVVHVDPRRIRRAVLVVRAWPPELAVADHHPARAEYRALVLRGRLAPAVDGLLPGDAPGDDAIGTGGGGRREQVAGALAADPVVALAGRRDVLHPVRQVRELVEYDVRPEAHHGLGECGGSNTSQATGPAPSARSMLALSGEQVMPATVCPSLISSETSRVPMTPLAPAMKMRTIVSL